MEDNQSLLDLQIDDEAALQLTETARWSKLMGILVLSALGLTLLMFFSLWTRMASLLLDYQELNSDAESLRTIKFIFFAALIIVGVIATIMMLFLIRGANGVRNGIRQKDQSLLNNGLAQIRNYFAMVGVLGIIGLVFSLMGFLSR